MRRVASWSIHDERPRLYGQAPGKCRWLIRLWAHLELEDGTGGEEHAETELRPRKALRITQCSDMAAKELTDLLAGRTVLDAGFDLFQLLRENR